MLPICQRGRRLIVISRNSMIETFALDRSFGGNEDRAHIDYTTLGETLLTLLGPSVCAGKKWFVVNGRDKRFHPSNASDHIQFYHTLIISMCSEKRHPMGGETFQCPPSQMDKPATFDHEEKAQSEPKKTMDLHTTASLIGRLEGLHMSLSTLRLHEHARDGVLTLYSVIRTYRDGDNNNIYGGKETIFRFRSSWVIPACTPLVTTRKSPTLKAKRKRVTRVFCHRYAYSCQCLIQKLRKTVSSG